MARTKALLTDARMLSPSVRSLTFQPQAPLTWAPGQYVDLYVPTRTLPYKRSYSIANPAPGDVEIAVTRVEGGPASTALHEMVPGTLIDLEGPRGIFVPRPAREPMIFVGTGSGLAPLRAMIIDELRKPAGEKLKLLFGCRTENDILWGEQLFEWRESYERFELDITLSRPSPGWNGRTGYVQKHLLEIVRPLLPAQIYVCGLARMVDEVVAILEGELPRSSIHYETYD
jgi:NAD(P)H-flavin reductase